MRVKLDLTYDQIVELVEQLPPHEKEKLLKHIGKQEALDRMAEIADEISSKVNPEDIPSMDEIQEVVDEVRRERYEERMNREREGRN